MDKKTEIKRVLVTPDLAQKWMLQNTHNRKLYQSVINAYAADMKHGNWILTHQGICFDEEGTLLDGQHRLQAVIESGTAIEMFVFKNMPKEQKVNGEIIQTQNTIDDIKKRTIGDKWKLVYGMQNTNIKAAMTNIIFYIITGAQRKYSAVMTKKMYDIFEEQIETVVEHLTNAPSGMRSAPILGSFAFAIGPFKNEIIEFIDKYFSGEDLKSGSPILVLRNFVLKGRSRGFDSYVSNREREYTRRSYVNNTLNCMMHFVLKNQLKMLKKTNQGLEFFRDKQRKLCDDFLELIRV